MESMDADRSWSTPEQAGADGLAAPPRRAAHVRRAEDYEAPPADALAASAGPRPITAPFPVPAPSPLAPPVSRPPAPSWEEVPPPPPLGSVRAPFPAPDAASAPFAAAAISDGGPLAEPSPAAFPPFVPGGASGGVLAPIPVPPDSVPAAVPTLPPTVPVAAWPPTPAASSPAGWTPPVAEPVIQDPPPAPFEATAESAPPALVEPVAPAPLTELPPPALLTSPADSPDAAGADVERTASEPAIPAFPPPASAPPIRSTAPDSFDALLAADPAPTGPDPAEPLPVSPFLGADRPDRADPPTRPDLDRSTVAERVGLVLAILLPPIGLVAGIVGMVASARRRGWVIGITKATTIVGVVLSIVAGIGGSVLADALRANAAHDALEAQSAAMCAAFAESPELLSAPDFGWPVPAGSIPDSIASMQDYAARWDAIAASAPDEIAPEAQAVAEAARELAGSVEVSRRVDDAQNIAVMTSVAQTSRLPAWVAEYCPAAP